jgi:cyclase
MRRLWLVASTVAAMIVPLAGVGQQSAEPHPPIAVHRISDSLYLLGSGMKTGGNTALLVTGDGAVLVDTKLSGYGPDILATVRKITDKPVRMIINTHTHFDHTGANTEFPASVEYVAHENIRAQMARPSCQPVTNCDAFKGENAKYLPATTFADRLSLYFDSDQIDLYHFGRGHTDGDTFVVFKKARTVHTGDMFPGRWLPYIDAENGNGGSATEFGRTLKKAVNGIADVDTLIAGHWDDPLPWSTLIEYSGFYDDLVEQSRRGIAAGRSAEETAAAYRVPERYREFGAPPPTVLAIVRYLYAGR